MIKHSDDRELLKIPEVVEEIKRHLWIESEKTGYDIGFEKAAEDWLNRFAKAWKAYHMPEKTSTTKTASKPVVAKKRRAKAYTTANLRK